MKVLAIDTSTFVMGVAVVDGQIVKGEMITNLKKNHSIRVMPAIESLLQECDVNPQDLDRIVVAKGPGSYTGVRIGVTIAKTLAWTLNIPLVGVSSLEVMAANAKYFGGLIVPLMDARRGQIYTGLYKAEGGNIQSIVADQVILATDWANELKAYDQSILLVGNDSVLHEATFVEVLGRSVQVASATLHNPRPSELAWLGMNREPEDVHTFVPNYIRLAEAEANWLARQQERTEC
ncbi:tRNA (adenosine(37)-N6)-threonylcarbamoyltransferase complex dimerization subunit type 1 TsaB [Anoxybacillus sp. CHMUD]|uniref:tRNA (adenosine(37)-N6)-threonylcarbamoyltransferase complex dimerization subunit type 1 TsaB n=1 Tax=Anoxybacillus sp. CHMUD TaxID=2508870 RepID=UPI0014916A53|nr:tRNA (adenosine(37)-N6)-threonylcarbamoyltransferase complex dimerization subunit type 1 TsaB [Anoxybacillus sp. CHMUD]NNU91574.1 tRNA (adenosine(37)-N6)-threonylcarbamoyltransferase complex dimerization subunit type 1 TsaB [Anoxybacillus sp. CHMUD]